MAGLLLWWGLAPVPCRPSSAEHFLQSRNKYRDSLSASLCINLAGDVSCQLTKAVAPI